MQNGRDIYESDFLKIVLYEKYALTEMIWKSKSRYMTDEDYKAEFINFVRLITRFKTTKGIIHTKQLYFPIMPDLQNWVNETIFPTLLSLGANKVAFLVNDILIIQMSIEQTMEETMGQNFLVKYFDNYEEAKKWILTQ